MKDTVLIVGYSPRLPGGVVNVQDLIRQHIPYVDLHVALYCYRPRWKSLVSFIYGACLFAGRLLVAPPRVVQVIVGSPGDAVRSVPYILLARIRGCRVCLHFHKDMASIVVGLSGSVRRYVLGTWRLAACFCYLSDRLRDEAARLHNAPQPRIVISNPISPAWLREAPLPRTRAAATWSSLDVGRRRRASTSCCRSCGRSMSAAACAATSIRTIVLRWILRTVHATAGCRKTRFARSCAKQSFCCSHRMPRRIPWSCSKRPPAALRLSPRTSPEYPILFAKAAAGCRTKSVTRRRCARRLISCLPMSRCGTIVRETAEVGSNLRKCRRSSPSGIVSTKNWASRSMVRGQ